MDGTPEYGNTGAGSPARGKRPGRGGIVPGKLLVILVLVTLGIVLVQRLVFRLNAVYVKGNVNKTAEQIVALTGLSRGMSIFAVEEDYVRGMLERDHTVKLLSMQKDYPSTVYLNVYERNAVAALQHLGMRYTIDDQGLVMEELSDNSAMYGMPVVTGMQCTSLHVGQTLRLKETSRLDAYKAVMSELLLQLFTDQISELNVSDVDNLYLVTQDGITVRLGDMASMRAKIGAMRTDVQYLRQQGSTSGILDVSIPEDAKYTPDS